VDGISHGQTFGLREETQSTAEVGFCEVVKRKEDESDVGSFLGGLLPQTSPAPSDMDELLQQLDAGLTTKMPVRG